MLISTKGRYALRIMAELAKHDSDAMIPLKEIAKEQEISEKYLEAIIKNLVKADFVVGLRGKGGGYRLARKPSEYNILEILEATEGSMSPVTCLEGENTSCPRENVCLTLPLWKGLKDLIDHYFSGISLKELASQTQEKADEL